MEILRLWLRFTDEFLIKFKLRILVVGLNVAGWRFGFLIIIKGIEFFRNLVSLRGREGN